MAVICSKHKFPACGSSTILAFATEIESLYNNSNEYHSSTHAAEVVHSAWVSKKSATPTERAPGAAREGFYGRRAGEARLRRRRASSSCSRARSELRGLRAKGSTGGRVGARASSFVLPSEKRAARRRPEPALGGGSARGGL